MKTIAANFDLNSSNYEYYTEDSFNNMLGEEKNRLNVNQNDQNSFSKNLSFLHLNIRSITIKIDSFSKFLERLKIKFPRLGLMTLFIVLTFPVTIFLHKYRNDR